MRYRAHWSNGFWKTFDAVAFEDVAVHGLERDAIESAARMNARRAK